MHRKRRWIIFLVICLVILVVGGTGGIAVFSYYTYSGEHQDELVASCPPDDTQPPATTPSEGPSPKGPSEASLTLNNTSSAMLTTASASDQTKLSINTKMFGRSPEFQEKQQELNADTINKVGLARGLNAKMRAVGVGAAIQESNLRNIAYGDRDSLGLFQQRPSQGWGTPTQIMNPTYAAGKFFDTLLQMTTPKQRETLSLMDLAMIVQRPDPSAYRARWDWDALAYSIVGTSDGSAYTNGTAAQSIGSAPDLCPPTQAGTNIAAALQAATDQIGVKYVWGGDQPGVAFDCSGLTQYVYSRAGVTLPRTAQLQYNATKQYSVPIDQIRPGDLLFFHLPNSRGPDYVNHVGIAWEMTGKKSTSTMLHAPNPNRSVGIYPLVQGDYNYWNYLVGATRPIQTVAAAPKVSTKWVEPNYVITSSYGRRFHPVKHVWKLHDGTDYGEPCGADVKAINGGKVVRIWYEANGGGNIVEVSHGRYHSRYEHLHDMTVKVGDTVSQGQVVGHAGQTGAATGCHLHLTIEDTSKPDHGWGTQSIDPVQFFKDQKIGTYAA